MNSRQYFYCSVMMFKFLYLQKIQDLKNHFTSKTPYSVVKNLEIDRSKYGVLGKPLKIWMVIRHGTRYPSLQQVKKMNSKLPSIHKEIMQRSKKNLSKSENKLLARAKSKFSKSYCNTLTPMGRCEMESLAKRMQKRFPELLFFQYDRKIYEFRFTHADRTLQSAQHFAIGLFGDDAITDNVLSNFKEDEELLRFYKLCSKWKNEVRRNPLSLNETTLFQKTEFVLNILERINKKLGMVNFLSFDDLETIYKACITETCNNKISGWCLLLDLNSVKILEFSEDLKHYWLDGYGFEITYKHACPLFKNMINFLNSDKQYPKVVLNFTHSGALLKMLSHLQLYKDDEPLKHDFNCENRKWRLSKICGFGSNLAFILYYVDEEYKVLVLHQERIIRLPCCPDDDLCNLETVKQHYLSSLRDCNFDRICSNI